MTKQTSYIAIQLHQSMELIHCSTQALNQASIPRQGASYVAVTRGRLNRISCCDVISCHGANRLLW